MRLDTQVLLEAVNNNVEQSKFKHLLKQKKLSISFCLYFVVKKKKVKFVFANKARQNIVLFEAVDNQTKKLFKVQNTC